MRYTIQTPSQLSTHFRALRKARGLSQAALGARLGLSQTRIARIEGDPLSISVEQLLRILSALGVQVSLEPLANYAFLSLEPMTASGSGGGAETPSEPAPCTDEGDW